MMGDRLVVYAGVLKNAGTFFSLYDVATAETSKAMAWKGIMAMAGQLPGPWAFLATELDWAGNNVIDAVTGQLMKRDIDKMTTMTEENLKQLKQTTDRMAVVGKQLGAIRQQLATLPPCDSTQLVKKEPDPPKSGGGGSIVKPIIVTAALAGAGIVGAQAYSQYKAAQDATTVTSTSGGTTSGGTTGSGSSVTYRVQATNSCTPGIFTDVGFAASCAKVIASSGACGNPTDFTVTVKNGVLTDVCGWLSSASVASGSYTGSYFGYGSLSSGIPVKGTFNANGTSAISGDGQYECCHNNSTDHVRLTFSRQ
jgi:hypothetical protein